MRTGETKRLLGGATTDLNTPRLSEVVLRTSNFDQMKDWYQAVLSLTPAYEYVPPDWNARRGDHHDFLATLASPVRLCFLRLHSDYPYTQVVALFEIASSRRPEDSAGLHHFQFRQASLDDLFLRFERLREVGVVPVRCMDHGPSTSFYYEDPDGNFVELSATNFEHESDYVAFFGSAAFAANPGGVTIEPAEYISAHGKAGARVEPLVVDSLGLGDFFHVGVVVRNLEDSMRKFARLFDVSGWATTVATDNRAWFRGVDTVYDVRAAFALTGLGYIELVEPLAGYSMAQQVLEERGEGVYHFAYWVDDIAETLERAAALGLTLEQVGPSTKEPLYGIVASAEACGVYIEFDSVAMRPGIEGWLEGENASFSVEPT